MQTFSLKILLRTLKHVTDKSGAALLEVEKESSSSSSSSMFPYGNLYGTVGKVSDLKEMVRIKPRQTVTGVGRGWAVPSGHNQFIHYSMMNWAMPLCDDKFKYTHPLYFFPVCFACSFILCGRVLNRKMRKNHLGISSKMQLPSLQSHKFSFNVSGVQFFNLYFK